jgi:hypothetical protein
MAGVKVPDGIIGNKFSSVRTASGDILGTDLDLISCNPLAGNISLTVQNDGLIVSGRAFSFLNESSLYSVTILSDDGDVISIIYPSSSLIIKCIQDNPTTISHFKTILPDPRVFKTDQYLDLNFFTRTEALGGIGNATTLYGWQAPTADGNWTDWSGNGKTLTRTGTLAAAVDHLGKTRYVVFDGANDYLTSTDAALKLDNGAWSMAAWVYQADWNSPDDGAIMSSYTSSSGSEGVFLALTNSSKTMDVYTHNSTTGVRVLTVDVSGLAAGWHHFAVSRSSAASHSMFVDGLLSSKTVITGTIDTATARYFDVGCSDSINAAASKLVGYLQDIVVHVGTAWTVEQVRKIYGRGSKLFCTVKLDGNLDIISPLEGKLFQFVPLFYKNDTTTSAGGANILGNYWIKNNLITLNVYAENLTNTAAERYCSTIPITPSSATFKVRNGGYGYSGAAVQFISAVAEMSNGNTQLLILASSNNLVWSNAGSDQLGVQITYPWQ